LNLNLTRLERVTDLCSIRSCQKRNIFRFKQAPSDTLGGYCKIWSIFQKSVRIYRTTYISITGHHTDEIRSISLPYTCTYEELFIYLSLFFSHIRRKRDNRTDSNRVARLYVYFCFFWSWCALNWAVMPSESRQDL
jgi:hypothetical protein